MEKSKGKHSSFFMLNEHLSHNIGTYVINENCRDVPSKLPIKRDLIETNIKLHTNIQTNTSGKEVIYEPEGYLPKLFVFLWKNLSRYEGCNQ